MSSGGAPSRLLKKGHLLRFPHPSSLRRTAKYASLLRISGALHLALFEQPGKDDFSSSLLEKKRGEWVAMAMAMGMRMNFLFPEGFKSFDVLTNDTQHKGDASICLLRHDDMEE